ncbi:MAG: ABC transporter permease [Clostridia bacterium]|nr:ABC transporter permease [Clostridia bacterium]
MMKNGILTIAKKELARFFRDRRMVLTTVFLPGILIYLIYSFLGSGMSALLGDDETAPYKVYVENMPETVGMLIDSTPMLDTVTYSSKEDALLSLEEERCDLVLLFDEDFDEELAASLAGGDVRVTPPTLHYYGARARSSEAYATVMSLLSALETKLNPPLIDMSESSVDLSTEEDVQGMLYSMLLPMLLMAMLFSGCLAVAPESIAGEKERGTIATMLVTPLQRSHLALGKILSLSLIALLSGMSSTVGILLSLPKLMGDAMSTSGFSMLGVPDMLSLAAVILSSVLVIVALVSLISSFARSVKEASTYVAPLMIIVMLLGVTTMFSSGDLMTVAYMIPLYNSVNCIAGIFGGDYSFLSIAVTALSNLAVMGLLTYALTLMFNHERMITDKS